MRLSLRVALLLVTACAVIHIGLGAAFIRSSAPTYDEPLHLASGYTYWKTGELRVNIHDHPPLAEMLAALPLLASGPEIEPARARTAHTQQYAYARHFLYDSGMDPERLLNSARYTFLFVWTLLLLIPIAYWAHAIGGPLAAAAAACAYAFFPGFISNTPLIATDTAGTAFFFIALGLMREASLEKENPRLSRGMLFALAGAVTGLALASKFNTIILPPLALGLAFYENSRSRTVPWKPFAHYTLIYIAAAGAFLILCYGVTQVPHYLEGLLTVLKKIGGGKPSFALGRHTHFGVWWYFPLALLVKTPIPYLILAAGGMYRLCRCAKREWVWLVVPPGLYFLSALTSKFQIGYRHILPIFPFLTVLAGIGFAAWASKTGKRSALAAFAACLLLTWQAASAMRAHPHYLAYFNAPSQLIGPPHSLFVGSNLDWGQGVKDLSEKLKVIGNPPIYLSYFGTADPAQYGIRYVRAGPVFDVPLPGTGEDSRDWDRILLAISATNLQGVYLTDKDAYHWLRTRRAAWTAGGGTILVYDLTGDADVLPPLMRLLAALDLREEGERLQQRHLRWRAMSQWRSR